MNRDAGASRWRNLTRWKKPTLVRRLLLGQVVLLGLLWSFSVLIVLSEAFNEDLFGATATYDAIIAVADNLADQPDKQFASLRALETALRENFGDRDEPVMAPSILVWQGAKLIYNSRGVPDSIHNTRLNVVEKLKVDGHKWHISTRQSPNSDTQVALIVSADTLRLILTFNSRGYYMLPLIISIPFLLLPAWLSIRSALRPWRQVGDEIASRGPHDLTPLAFQPRHEELRPLVDSINALMQRLRDSGERERHFIADAAHELRTPIAAMRVNVEALQARHGLTERQNELLGGVLRSSDRATRLVGQLLRLMRSNAETHTTPNATLTLDALVQERLAEMSGLAHVRGVELELDVDAPGLQVAGEREAMMSMIDNLIDNATKYSPPDSTVWVRVQRDADHAVLTVTDQGPGIAPELRSRVFDRFYRNPDQAQTGSGLGLAIVKAVVEKNDGLIALASVPGGASGLQVVVRLPLA